MTPQEFYDTYLPYAERVQSNLGFNSPTIFLAQWALETAWGSSLLATQYNNLAGINYNGVACYRAVGGFAGYTTLDNFVIGYEAVLRIDGWGYPAFLSTKDGTFAEQAAALGASDWAASHYGTPPGSDLQAFADELPSGHPTTSGGTATRPTYTVQSGDTLSGIAAAHGFTLSQIEGWNPQFSADWNLIHPGDTVYLGPASDPTPTPTADPTPAPTPAPSSPPVGKIANYTYHITSAAGGNLQLTYGGQPSPGGIEIMRWNGTSWEQISFVDIPAVPPSATGLEVPTEVLIGSPIPLTFDAPANSTVTEV